MRALPFVLLTTACIEAGLRGPGKGEDDTDAAGVDLPDTDTDAATDTDGPGGGLIGRDTDTGTDTVAPDDSALTCTATVVITSTAAAPIDDYTVEVQVPPLPGAQSDLSNLQVTDAMGVWLLHWVQEASAGKGTIWVRLPQLVRGVQRLTLDVCDPGRDVGKRPGEIFPVWESFRDPTLPGWDMACTRIDQASESCTVEGVTVAGESVLRLASTSSCFGPPYSGAGALLSRMLTLPAGTWVTDWSVRHTGSHDDFCSGATATEVAVRLDAATASSVGCGLAACSSCDLGWQDITSPGVRLPGGPVLLSLEATSGDCASAESFVDDVWLRQVAVPEPTVVVTVP
ncbi:MAG: hypothetical protein H6732_07580 [Alphaproteobacteria bacterium]|nr:hypothetical protein [Alphaproteobacteria bacterium]